MAVRPVPDLAAAVLPHLFGQEAFDVGVFAETEQSIAQVQLARAARIGNDFVFAMQAEHDDVELAQAGAVDGAPGHTCLFPHIQLDHAVAATHGQALADVELGIFDVVGDVVDDRARDVALGRSFDALEPG